MSNRHNILAVLAAVSVLLYSCKGGDDSSFSISGKLSSAPKGAVVKLNRLDSTQFTAVDSAVIGEDGKFELKNTTPFANLYRLQVGDDSYDVIAKNGDDIEFTADANAPAKYEFKGGQETAELKAFNNLTAKYASKNAKLSEEYDRKTAELGSQSDSLINIYRPIFQQNIREYNDEAIAFINKNKDKLTAFYAASSVDPREYEQQLIAYAEGVKDKFKDNPLVSRYVRLMLAAKPVSVGQKAPEFTIKGLDGKDVSLADYKGKYVMLDFWASWCVPCRQENPNVVRMYNIYHPKGLNILGISLDQDKAKWQQAIAADKLTWAHASDLQNFEGPVERLYQINAIPSNFIIDPQGVIIAKNITGPQLEEFLKKTFSKPQ